MSKDTVRIKDQLGRDPETFPLLNANYSEECLLEEGALIFDKTGTGVDEANSWVVGSSTNGVVGTNTGTDNGLQQVVGRGSKSYFKVVNPNNVFTEKFEFEDFENVDVTTATGWGTASLSFTNGQVAQSLSVYKDTTNISRATINVDDSTNLTVELSADGGTTWDSVTFGTENIFSVVGSELLFKLTASGVATVTELIISYGV